ncbi:MAG: YfhO family protein [Clostridia bacterium]|nr:YfhO family protein [Clostridia bacterium]
MDDRFDDAVSGDAVSVRIAEPAGRIRSYFDRLRAYLYGKKYLGFCFLIPAFLLLLAYLFRGVYPASTGSVLVLDLNGQYVYFHEALRDIITDGGSFVYSFRRALGGEFMGIFAYYLASPLTFIVALFPKEHITEAIYFLLVLKCGLCGFTFGIFAHKTRPRHPLTTITFSVMWALCSFAVVMQHNLMWTDCIILFPLILLGIQKIVKEGKISLYVITLSLAVLSNFYIGYMVCIFSGVYFFLYYASKNRSERNPRGVKIHFGKSFLRFVLASLCAICISAVIILPTYYSLSLGKSDFSDPNFVPSMKFNLADMFTKFYFGSYDNVRPDGLPFLYTGTLTLLVAPLYFVCKKIAIREKIVSAVTFIFFTVSMNITTLDLVWHGFQKPNWLNYRYAFMLCFFLVFWGMRAFEHIREISFKWVIATFALTSAVLIIFQKIGYDNLPNMRAILPSLLIAFVLLCIVRGVRSNSLRRETGARTALLIFICAEMLASTLVNFNDLDNDVSFSSRSRYRDFIDRVSVAVADINEHDSSFYRTEKTFMKKTNDNMALGIFGLSGSTSTLNAETIKFLQRLGFASKSHWTKYIGETPVSDSLLGVKYIIAKDGDVVNEVNEIFDYPDKDMTVYENPFALSIATAVSTKLTNAPFTDEGTVSPFDRMNDLVSYMLGTPDADGVFREAELLSISTENITETNVANHYKYAKTDTERSARVNYTIKVDSTDPIYCYFPSKYTRLSELIVNGQEIGSYYDSESYIIYCIGRFSPGETVTVTLKLEKSELYVDRSVSYFRYLDTNRFEEAFRTLGEYPLTVSEWTEDSIYGTITVPEDRTQIYTSIPYDAGWVVCCDGERVETSDVLSGLLTFTLEPGEHELSMEYKPECVKQGNIISILGLIAFILIAVSNKLLLSSAKKKREALRAALPAPDGTDGSGFSEEQPETECRETEDTTDTSDVPDISGTAENEKENETVNTQTCETEDTKNDEGADQ